MKFWKILGIAALFAIPTFLIVKKLREEESTVSEDEFDIFAEELN
jgi:hypothetical protein